MKQQNVGDKGTKGRLCRVGYCKIKLQVEHQTESLVEQFVKDRLGNEKVKKPCFPRTRDLVVFPKIGIIRSYLI